ncbi:MAG: hypothetical protein JWN25_3547, partial [Verrucomicrobiales bacterium]|nr:hypothetical protein [Verrucomicrobiales bacterium]
MSGFGEKQALSLPPEIPYFTHRRQ